MNINIVNVLVSDLIALIIAKKETVFKHFVTACSFFNAKTPFDGSGRSQSVRAGVMKSRDSVLSVPEGGQACQIML